MSAPTTARGALGRLLTGSRFEIIPLKNAVAQAQHLPSGATVSITASPAKDMEATIALAEELQALGLEVIPHLSARMTRDQAHLEKLLARMGEAGMHRAFIVGGDATDPGEFTDAPALMAALARIDHGIGELGITGYPEGHPTISDEALRRAMAIKAPQADYIATQMCFDVAAILSWIREIRAAGIDLPLYIGIPGVVDPVRLASIGARIGVGTSLRYVMKNRAFLWKLLRPGPYKPTKLVRGIAEASAAAEHLGIHGFHIFTFNEVERTVAWWQAELQRVGAVR